MVLDWWSIEVDASRDEQIFVREIEREYNIDPSTSISSAAEIDYFAACFRDGIRFVRTVSGIFAVGN